MRRPHIASRLHSTAWLLALMGLASWGITACGGGTGTHQDSGAQKTFLRVEAVDADGDALSYQWRVTAGTIDNRNSRETVWTLPSGPGLHFAYATVSDGKGGSVEQQYAVSTDAINEPTAHRADVNNTPPTIQAGDEFDGGTARLRLISGDATLFASGGTSLQRKVYLPDISVSVVKSGTSEQVFAGSTDLSGELALPKLAVGQSYDLVCRTRDGVTLSGCTSLAGTTDSQSSTQAVTAPSNRNLRLFGHIALADGSVCGIQNEFFGLQTAATVQVLAADGTAMSTPLHVNRFGDYAVDASVGVQTALKLKVQCDGFATSLDLPRPNSGYSSATPVELSYVIPNSRPTLVKMVANGPDGSVRGKMITAIPQAYSNGMPGAQRFLAYKGQDTRLSACMYYRSFGAVRDCDAQGRFVDPITLDDWKRQHKLSPYNGTNTEVSAVYINQRDLSLVRNMIATQSSANDTAFYVCNAPGPDGLSQREADDVISTAMANEKRVACVAMESSVTPGRNGDQPFTKFLTFSPDGSLIASVNLDKRGEKYMPGACVACHGGSKYIGRFPETGNPSPDLNAKFLPFDTGNYVFSSAQPWTEAAQGAALRRLNELVLGTQPAPATTALINGWYAGSSTSLDKTFVPAAWSQFDPTTASIDATRADSARFYREIVATSCRTCHTAMRTTFDWDASLSGVPRLLSYRNSAHICGGSADVLANGSMPNALSSVDRMQDHIQSDATLALLVQKFLGCTAPAADPAYPKR